MGMKYIIPVMMILAILCSIGVVGFVYFNKRLEESNTANQSVQVSDSLLETANGSSTGSASNISSGGSDAVESSISLQVLSPSDGSTVTTPTITIRGKTVPSAEVFINDTDTVADTDGNFSVQMTLEEGDNPILFVANDSDGRAAEAEITVTYDPGE